MNEPYLSIAVKLALKPWFSDEILEQGLLLLASGQVRFLFHRQAAGALFEGGKIGTASLRFEFTERISQGFRLADSRCSLCRKIPGKGENCSHLAALAIAMLGRQQRQGEKPLPLPLLFPDTPWQVLGAFLFDHYHRRGEFRLTVESDGCRLRFRDHNLLLLDSLLPPEAAGQMLSLFGSRLLVEGLPRPAMITGFEELFDTLQGSTLSETETTLRSLDRESRGVERDCSLWLWLARRLAGELGSAALRLEQSGEGEFLLRATTGESRPVSFSLLLERVHAAGLLKTLGAVLPEPIFLPPARQFFRVEIAADSSLLVTPCLRLADGRTFSRPDLAGQAYGSYYYLPAEGFLPVAPPVRECDLRPAAAGPRTLFDWGSRKTDHNLPFTVANREIPAFIDRNRQALNHDENEVAPALLAAPCRERPDGLEFLAAEEDDHWLYLAGHYRIDGHRVDLVDLVKAGRQGLSYLPGSALQLTGTPLDWFYRLGEERLWRRDGELRGVRLNRREFLRLTSLIGETALPEDGAGDELRRLLQVENWRQPACLPACPDHLREYQRHGLAWLYHLHAYGLGGILADDMGLGKTHQALGLCWLLRRGGAGGRFLVVCPATVAFHWAMKLERFYPELSWSLYHGQERDLGGATKIEVLITTYGVLRQDGGLLAGIPFEVVIFDEMQQLKNKKTAVYQAASLLSGRIKIGLTGTPLENSVHDLKALFDLCLPGLLGSDKAFAARYAVPGSEQGGRERQEELARLLGSFFLRRDRRQVLTELPEIIEEIRTCELSSDQVALYREAIGKEQAELLEELAEGREIPYLEVLALIGTLKQICNHPALLADEPGEAAVYASGKWDLFVELLAECLAAGMKVVVFSQYTRMLDIIERYLTAEGIEYCGLRGDMSLKARQGAINRFNGEPACRVFCASLLAGGTGIDLTAAAAVIHYDRWWNAAKEDQATARVHRLGQQQVVQVFKLVTVGTLEEKIHRLIESKRDLAGKLIRADDAAMVKQLGREDLLELLGWQKQ